MQPVTGRIESCARRFEDRDMAAIGDPLRQVISPLAPRRHDPSNAGVSCYITQENPRGPISLPVTDCHDPLIKDAAWWRSGGASACYAHSSLDRYVMCTRRHAGENKLICMHINVK